MPWLHEVMHEQVDGGIGAWYRRHRGWADPAGMALLAVVMAALGFRGVWGSFSLLSGPVSPWWALAFALPACALALVKRRLPMTVLGIVTILFVADLLTVAGALVSAAHSRTETRGCHWREDHPDAVDAWRGHLLASIGPDDQLTTAWEAIR